MGVGGGEGQEQKEEEGSREWLKQSLYNTGELISFALQDDSGLLSLLYTAIPKLVAVKILALMKRL